MTVHPSPKQAGALARFAEQAGYRSATLSQDGARTILLEIEGEESHHRIDSSGTVMLVQGRPPKREGAEPIALTASQFAQLARPTIRTA